MARIQTVIKNLLSSFTDPTGRALLELPENIRKDLSVSLKEDEDILISMKTERAIYKAGQSRDSNTYYKTIAVLTSKRLILARQSSRLKIFRDFQLSEVSGLLYEEVNGKPTIHADLLSSKYILSMPPGSFDEAKEFFDAFNSTIGPEKSEDFLCTSCGKKIRKDSVYCSHCGKKISDIGNEND